MIKSGKNTKNTAFLAQFLLRAIAIITVVFWVVILYKTITVAVTYGVSYGDWLAIAGGAAFIICAVGAWAHKRWAVISLMVLYSIFAVVLDGIMILFWHIWNIYGDRTVYESTLYVLMMQIPLLMTVASVYSWRRLASVLR